MATRGGQRQMLVAHCRLELLLAVWMQEDVVLILILLCQSLHSLHTYLGINLLPIRGTNRIDLGCARAALAWRSANLQVAIHGE